MKLASNFRRLTKYQEALAYYEGDIFQFDIAPRLEQGSANAKEINAAIDRLYQTANKVKECVDRHRRALVGKSPTWNLDDGGSERSPLVRRAELELQQILDNWQALATGHEHKLGNAINEAVKQMLLYGVGYLRLWSPRKYQNAANNWQRVALHAPDPDSVEITRDDDGFAEKITYTYKVKEETRKEIQWIDAETGMTMFQYQDEEQGIVLTEDGEGSFGLDLGGRWTIYEMRGRSLVTDSVKRNQNAINFALSLIPRNLEYAGFIREYIFNGQPTGTWEADSAGNQKFIPDKAGLVTGPGITTFLTGLPNFGSQGELVGYTTPTVYDRQPISIQTFTDALRAHIACVYEEMGQAHLLAADAILSGVSRTVLRQDFELALQEDASAIASTLSAVYASALLMINQERIEEYRNLKAVVKLNLAASQPLPEELEQLLKWNQAGNLSKSTALSLSGFVDDTDAELALLKEELNEAMRAMATVPYTSGGTT